MNPRALFIGKWRLNRTQFVIIFIILSLFEYVGSYLIDYFFLYTEEWLPSNYWAFLWIILTFITAFLFTSIVLRRSHDIWIRTWLAILPCIYLFWFVLVSIITMPFFAFILGMMLSWPISESIDWDFISLWMYWLFIFPIIFYIYCLVIAFIKWENNKNKFWSKPENIKTISGILKFWINN